MEDLRYILGQPIEIDGVGTIYPLNILEYHRYIQNFNVLMVTKNLLLQQISMKDKEKRNKIEQDVKNFDVILSDENAKAQLVELLKIVFKRDDIQLEKLNKTDSDDSFISIGNKGIIHRDNYDHVRNLIIKANAIPLPKQAKSKELQKWYDKAYKKRAKGSDQDLEDILTTIMVITGYTPQQISKMTIYQINSIIARVNKIKEFDMNVQFLCVGAKDINLQPFTAHIDLLEEEKINTSFESFKKNFGSILGNQQ